MSTWRICPKCGDRDIWVKEFHRFCGLCGVPYVEKEIPDCPKCGENLAGYEKFCRECGTELNINWAQIKRKFRREV